MGLVRGRRGGDGFEGGERVPWRADQRLGRGDEGRMTWVGTANEGRGDALRGRNSQEVEKLVGGGTGRMRDAILGRNRLARGERPGERERGGKREGREDGTVRAERERESRSLSTMEKEGMLVT